MTPAQSVETLLREALEECRDKLNIFRLSDLKDKAAIEAADYAIAMADTALQSISEPLLDEGLVQYLGEAVGEALREAEHKGDGCDFTEVIRDALLSSDPGRVE